MISSAVQNLMLENEDTFLIPADNVANVMVNNPLNHALLVLSQVKYSKIPVLDKGDRFVGLLSLSDVVEKMLELKAINIESVDGFTVADVMEVGVPTLSETWELEDLLHLLVDAAFLPVVDEEKTFKGIVTRKEVLKAVNRTFHELDKNYPNGN
ncbi:putative transcriptional regulator [Enterococcus sp. PF1-24]|uniref:cyclic-di-AMP-binding protein CbpB n=1 Tax=unclassified Enterococcus TaxID=2608891 RepID=UPI00247701BF|nr:MULTISPECIES: cyclic-di-AMP-binding protein CbpB [unclassified Enterococcus]MDH6363030.1 putative transcriptional regulator [Enterococcus sp. PFB1-1]MDH6400124.1 putative transcriptional regulator [Enterococcus sp. PF1-24]